MIRSSLFRFIVMSVGALAAGSVLAQMPQMPMMSLGQNSALIQLFGATKEFSSRVETVVKSPKDTATLPMEMAILEGKMRMELDMTKMKSREVSAENSAMMKQMGMDRMIIVTAPAEKAVRYIFPGLEAYTEMPIQGTGGQDAAPKLEAKELGKETVDGHPCVKNQVTIVEASGQQQQFTVWNATDLKQFPVKIEMSDKGGQTVMSFKDVKLAAPDAKLFAAPAGYSKHTDMQQMMMSAMQKKFK